MSLIRSIYRLALVCLLVGPSLGLLGPNSLVLGQDETTEPQVFSGPQVGEALPEFVFRELLVEPSGRDLNLVGEAAGGPVLLVFVHELNRPSIGFTRTLTAYAHSRRADGLKTAVILLDSDATAAEASLLRIRHAMTPGVFTGVSVDGQEGPGSYGLNRKVALTILVAKDNLVTSNFALVQPSLQADLPKVLEGLVSVVGGTIPKLEELEGMPAMRQRESNRESNRGGNGEQRPNLRPLLQPLLNKQASADEIDAAAAVVERAVAEDMAMRRELGRACKTIVDANVLQNYGTVKTQEYFKKWAEAYGNQSTDIDQPKR